MSSNKYEKMIVDYWFDGVKPSRRQTVTFYLSWITYIGCIAALTLLLVLM